MHTSVKGDVFWRFWGLPYLGVWVTRTRASTCVNIQAPTQTHMRHIVHIYIHIYIYIYMCVCVWLCVCVYVAHIQCVPLVHAYLHIYTCAYIYIQIYVKF